MFYNLRHEINASFGLKEPPDQAMPMATICLELLAKTFDILNSPK